jgi:hypothetical protein
VSRFRKGTLDHDGNGKPGGSMKETDMATTKKPAPRKKASAHTPQTGMEPGPDLKVAEKAAKDQFAEADAKAAPDEQALADLQVQRSVRGW